MRVLIPEAEFLVIFSVRVFNLRSYHLGLSLGRAPPCIHIIGTVRRAQVRPSSSIFEQDEPWTEPQLKLR
jgi:hypothetical protein